MKTFLLRIVSPESNQPDREVTLVDVPAQEGRLTVLAGHERFICSLRSGSVKILPTSGEKEQWSIEGGTMAVEPERVTLLVRSAISPT